MGEEVEYCCGDFESALNTGIFVYESPLFYIDTAKYGLIQALRCMYCGKETYDTWEGGIGGRYARRKHEKGK